MSPPRLCWHTLFFVEMPHIDTDFGVTPNT
jgi:hypothetical protein